MRWSIVVAAAENDVIGSRGQLPWRLPEDLKRFKALTLGKPVLMGRTTHESIGRALPGRTNLIVSRQPGLSVAGCVVVPSIEAAAGAVPPDSQLMVIGGAQIYLQALPRVTTIHLTRVHAQLEGDVVFPTLAPEDWREVAREYHPADERHAYAFSFIQLERIVR
jgi:dihydrofolate reductase